MNIMPTKREFSNIFSSLKCLSLRCLIIVFSFFILLSLSSIAKSDGNPFQALSGAAGLPIQGPWDAAGSIAAIQRMYQTMVVQLQELKTQSEFLSDVNKVAKESLRQYDAVQNASLEAVTKRISEDVEAVTMLDNMNNMDNRQKLETLSKELDRRIADPNTPELERKRLNVELSFLLSLKRLQDLEEAANQNLGKSAGAITEREGQQITSQSVAILTKLQILESKRRYKAFMASVNDKKIRQNLSMPSKIMDKIGGHDVAPLNDRGTNRAIAHE